MSGFGASANNSLGECASGTGTERPGVGMTRFFSPNPMQRGATE